MKKFSGFLWRIVVMLYRVTNSIYQFYERMVRKRKEWLNVTIKAKKKGYRDIKKRKR
jgi:hypothetical protein